MVPPLRVSAAAGFRRLVSSPFSPARSSLVGVQSGFNSLASFRNASSAGSCSSSGRTTRGVAGSVGTISLLEGAELGSQEVGPHVDTPIPGNTNACTANQPTSKPPISRISRCDLVRRGFGLESDMRPYLLNTRLDLARTILTLSRHWHKSTGISSGPGGERIPSGAMEYCSKVWPSLVP